jgi:hypothetical protein
MFRGLSQCMSSVGVLYFGLFSLFEYSSLPFYFPSPVFQLLSIHIFTSSTFTPYDMWYYWCSIILFSFLSFSEFHRVVPLKQMCSTTEFVYDHAYFCVYIYSWIYLPCMKENMHLLCFWSWITSLNMMFSNSIHLPSNPMSLFLVTE